MTIPPAARALIETWRLGFIATADADGRPNLSPKGTFIVVDDKTLAFSEIRSPATLANIEARPEVEVNFIDMLSRKGVRARGSARFVPRGEAGCDDLLAAYDALFGAAFVAAIRGVVRIDVESCRPLTSPIYDLGAVEEEVRAQWIDRFNAIYAEDASGKENP